MVTSADDNFALVDEGDVADTLFLGHPDLERLEARAIVQTINTRARGWVVYAHDTLLNIDFRMAASTD